GSKRAGAGFTDLMEELLPGPGVVRTFDAVAVGVLGAREPSLGLLHVADQIRGGLVGDRSEGRLARHLPGLDVQLEQLRVVRQHLFEVRYPPSCVGAVTSESAAHVIADAPGPHTR